MKGRLRFFGMTVEPIWRELVSRRWIRVNVQPTKYDEGSGCPPTLQPFDWETTFDGDRGCNAGNCKARGTEAFGEAVTS